MPADLLIIGASSRAAAHSALRGGLRPMCVDLFGDTDLRSVADVLVIDDYPQGLPKTIERLPPCPWMYTGGLENHPRIVGQLAQWGPLLGNGPDILTRVRDPWWLEVTLRMRSLPAPGVWPAGTSHPPQDGRWLRKPLRGAGGRGISVWDAKTPPADEPVYYQHRTEGEAYSAQFVATMHSSKAPSVKLLGITRQWVGLSEACAPPFAWCGALTPVSLPNNALETMQSVGARLAMEAGLCGLFGCDFVVDGETPWLTEVNPRYTAAMELLDFQTQSSLVASHVEACGDRGWCARTGKGATGNSRLAREWRPLTSNPEASGEHAACGIVRAKLVLFADRHVIIGDTAGFCADSDVFTFPTTADVPLTEQSIAPGQPICTLFAEEATEAACLARLRERVRDFQCAYLRRDAMR